MTTITLTHLLQLAGLLHLGSICAGALMPRVVNMRQHVTALPAFLQRLFWVYYGFIGFCIFSFGLATFFFAGTLASGGALPRAICAFLALFWGFRLVVAAFVFDLRPFLTSFSRRAGCFALDLVFTYLPLVYLLAALKGSKL